MSKIIHRNLRAIPPLAVGAHGIVLRDSRGNTYIDASGGAAVSSLGHAHPDVLSAMHRQIDRIATGWRLRRVAEPLIVNLAAQTPASILAAKTVPESALAHCRQLGAALAAGLGAGIF